MKMMNANEAMDALIACQAEKADLEKCLTETEQYLAGDETAKIAKEILAKIIRGIDDDHHISHVVKAP